MKQIILTLLILIIASSACFATGEYLNPAYDTKTIKGMWTGLSADEVSDNFAATSTGLNLTYATPLVGDLDGNGVNEIIIFDGNNAEIYQDKTLTSISGANAEDTINHAILYDIDGDTYREVITAGGDKVSIFSFNGTSLNLDANHTINNLAADGNEFMIGCKGTNDCMLFDARYKSGVPSNENLSAYFFTSTTINSTYHSLLASNNNGDFYFPKIRTVTASDYDLDGVTEYILSAYDGGSALAIKILHVTPSTMTSELTYSLPASYILSDTGRDDFTSPLVADFDVTSSGLETVIAYQADSTEEFEMLLLSKLGSEIDDYPELTFTQGTLISNPIMGNFLSGNVNANKDFCVMGYDTPADQMILLCGSASADVDSAEYDVDVNYDLSDFQYYPNTLIHSVQSSQSTSGGVNLNEVLTPYGIISVIYTGSDRAVLDYNITASSFGISIPSDVEKTGYFDILYRTNDGLYYIDDGFSNAQLNIDSFTFSRSPICVNRTYTMTVQFSDAEGDAGTCLVAVKLDNETNLWNTTNRTGASGVSIYIKPNETGYFFYDLYCTDSIAVTPDFERKQIDVNNDLDTCYEPGESDEISNIVSPDEEVENEDFTGGVDSILDNFMLSSPKARNVLAIILSFAAAVIVYLKSRRLELALTAKISAALVLFYLGIMSILPLVIIIIVCAYFLSKTIIGGSPSSG